MTVSDPIRGYSEADRYWTTTNTSEAVSAIMKPLDCDLWGPANHLGTMKAWASFGLVPDRLVTMPTDQNQWTGAVFFGRYAANVDLCRALLGNLPGMDPDDFELSITGSLRPDGYRPPPATAEEIAEILRLTEAVRSDQDRRIETLAAEYRTWWNAEVLGAGDQDPAALMQDSFDRFVRAVQAHNQTRLLSMGHFGGIYRLAATAGQIEAVPAVFAAFGDVDEVGMAQDLWRYAAGETTLEEFVAHHGFHGENEGNPSGRSWREDSRPLEAVAATLGSGSQHARPAELMERAVAAKQAALPRLLASLGSEEQDQLMALLEEAGPVVRQIELGKTAFLMAVDGYRAGARAKGAELVAEGRLQEVDDVFHLTLTEILERDYDNLEERVAARRARWVEYSKMQVPTVFTGMPELQSTEIVRAAVGDEFSGSAVSAGKVTGRARVLTKIDLDSDLEPGEILVCRSTDPSWTPVLMLASAAVMDIGGIGSHGAIVARELGIPAVANTSDCSARLRDGDLIEVDGNAGVVRVLACADVVAAV